MDANSIQFSDTNVNAEVTHSKGNANLQLSVSFFESGAARIRITEKTDRWQVLRFYSLLFIHVILIVPFALAEGGSLGRRNGVCKGRKNFCWIQ